MVSFKGLRACMRLFPTAAFLAGCVDSPTAPAHSPTGQKDQLLAATLYPGSAAGALHPVISTYLGGSAFEHARDVATDAAGNIYVVGGTQSANFPTTAGAFQRIHNPGTPSKAGILPMDVFVMKLGPTGQLIWSTFLGGPNYDRAYAVEVDGQGNVYVAGRAGAGFPVTSGAFQTTFRGGQEASFYGPQDGFVCKLNATGSARIYCSYFGSGDPRIVRDLAIDGLGNAYLASSANQDLPRTWFTYGYQKTRAGGVDGVVAKINPLGTRVLWATYLGGAGDEGHGENSIRVDPAGNVYFLQNTSSAGLPTPNGFDRAFGGQSDVYLAKLAPSGGTLLYASYIGGAGPDYIEAHSLALDAAGNAYAAVTTGSTNFPTTTGALLRTYGGSGGSGTGGGTNYPLDLGVVKVSPGGALLAGTYLGGRYGEGAEGIGIDGNGNVCVSGGTFSDNFPATASPYQNRGGNADMIVSKLAPNLGSLVFSQEIGGSGFDVGRSTHCDLAGNMYVVGEVRSTNFYTINALRSAFGGGSADAGLVKLVPAG